MAATVKFVAGKKINQIHSSLFTELVAKINNKTTRKKRQKLNYKTSTKYYKQMQST